MSQLWAPLLRRSGSLVDRGLLRAMMRGRFPTLEDYARVSRELHHAHGLYAEHLALPASFHPAPPRLERLRVRRGRLPGLRYERISFESGYEPHPEDAVAHRYRSYGRNNLGWAWTLRHRDLRRPWLVCLHGLGTGSPWMDLPGFRATQLHHDFGLNLLFPVLPLHGPRRAPGMVRGALLSFELAETVHGLAHAVWDTRRLLGWLRGLGAEKVGLYGVSMGAYAAALVSAVEEVDLVIAGIPLADVPELYSFHSPADHAALAEEHGILGDRARELFRLISPLSLLPRTPVDRRFIIAGLADEVTTPAQARVLWEAWGRPTIRWYHGGHVSYFWSTEVNDFVEETLRHTGFSSEGGGEP